jgi:hypothetical protein
MFVIVEERDAKGTFLGWAVYRDGKRVSKIFDNLGEAEKFMRSLEALEEPDSPTEIPPSTPTPF